MDHIACLLIYCFYFLLMPPPILALEVGHCNCVNFPLVGQIKDHLVLSYLNGENW